MYRTRNLMAAALVLLALVSWSQTIEGYAYESGNRGYLNVVKVDLADTNTGAVLQSAFSDLDGKFVLDLPPSGTYQLLASKDMFTSRTIEVDRSLMKDGKIFVKLEMKRAPGYVFEVTLAPMREDEDIAVDGIRGARIEVYNNTTKQEELVLIDHPDPEFKLNLLKGNHYTILVRKKGYLAKRMEALVNVQDCILCFEGVGKVEPGVADNLSEGNEMGVLLANVEMEPSVEGLKMTVNNLYYDVGKATLRKESRDELVNLINIMKDNPELAVEIGSHTDSRGKTDYNMKLSEDRAQAVVTYLINNGDIRSERLLVMGYGESQILNRCIDGVKCTEAEHQQNRRTELKIVGRVAEARFMTLVDMKREEQMQDLILELQDQEQVIINTDEELQELLQQKPGSAATPDQPEDIDGRQGQNNNDMAPLPPASKTDGQESAPRVAPTTLGGVDEPGTGEMSQSRRNSIRIQEMKRKKLEAQLNNSLKKAPADKATEVQPPPAKKVDTPDLSGASMDVPPPTILREDQTLAVDGDGELLTAFMVVIKEEAVPLAPDDEIFVRHNRVYSYRTPDGAFLYMLGKYPTLGSAEQELAAFLKVTYEGAYIIKFLEGVIIEEIKEK